MRMKHADTLFYKTDALLRMEQENWKGKIYPTFCPLNKASIPLVTDPIRTSSGQTDESA